MQQYILPVQIRWSDLDANAHLRHSVYYDWGSYCRIAFLNEQGLSTTNMHELHIGPILFREEAIFKKEIRQEDKVTIDLKLVKARKDYSRFSIRHTIMKNKDTVAAVITVEGAWMDTVKRKLCTPPAIVATTYNAMPKSEDFEWI
jgi:hypothetical protein